MTARATQFASGAGLLLLILLVAVLSKGMLSMSGTDSAASGSKQHSDELAMLDSDKFAKATFGTGCFWCTEAVFQQLKGVHAAVSGYSGGLVKNPTYDAVCDGTTGHAEVIQITFDPEVIAFDELLEVFFQSHDPTTLNRQGNDVGPQYRSAIFYHNDEQRRLAEHYKRKLNESGAFDSPIVTEISPFAEFYVAEKYHQNYYDLNSRQPYCAMIIRPKLDKVRKVFKDKLKSAPPK